MNDAISRPLVLAMGLAFPAAHIVMGLGNLDRIVSIGPTLLAMAISLGLMALVIWPTEDRGMSLHGAVIGVAGVLVVDLLVQSVLPAGSHPGYAAWHCGAIQMLMVTLAIRKRIAVAWIGISLFAVLDFSGSVLRGLSPLDAAAMVVTPLTWVAIAHAVSLGLNRCDGLISKYQKEEQTAAATLAQEHARWLSENEWLRELERTSKPLLTKIAAGTIDETDRINCHLMQEELRDQVRGRVLATAAVLKSARAARSRGVTVEIFDDRGTDLPDALLRQASAHLIDILDRADQGFVKARALPLGQRVSITILAYDDTTPSGEFYLELQETA